MVIEGANGPTTPEADKHQVRLRTATFIVACSRILQARKLRGLYP
jgi:glutamate dehydrogenase (NAD(P)+)